MKIKPSNLAPLVIACAVLLLAGVLHFFARLYPSSGALVQLEWLTYDARVKLANRFANTNDISTNLATVFLDDTAFQYVNDGRYSPYMAANTNGALAVQYKFKWPWPTFIHGQIVRELSNEGATAIGFDVLFPEEDESRNFTDFPTTNGIITSDAFFAEQIKNASNVVLAVENNVMPAPIFRENVMQLGDIATASDYGVLRRMKPFHEITIWNPRIVAMVKPLSLELENAKESSRQIIIPKLGSLLEPNPPPLILNLNTNGALQLTKEGELKLDDDPTDIGPSVEFPKIKKRVWNLGLVLAAKQLNLDLENATISAQKITLRSPQGIVRELPLDEEGYMYIDWGIRFDDLKAQKTPVFFGLLQDLLMFDTARQLGDKDAGDSFKGRLVVIGSIAVGNNVSDYGSTPLESHTALVTKHLNVANSILKNRFVQRAGAVPELLIILALGIFSAALSWRSRVVTAGIAVAFVALLYVGISSWLYVEHRYWLAMVLPIGGGLILPHFSLVTYRVVFEQKEQRRVKGIFKKIVSPDIVQELLDAEKLDLVGARMRLTVLFADVRGFTELTDSRQDAADKFIREKNLPPDEAQKYFDKDAAETLDLVNTYLSTISDVVKKHDGTLDKYIGDCVMAFWGAPVPNPRHAICCVRAAIDAQRALAALNQKRFAENERRKNENAIRETEGKPPLPMLPLLVLGTGINTGHAIVGLMGSDSNILNYTVFGREVNLASRLEGVSGRGRIIIGEGTYADVKRDDPDLAAKIVELPPTMLKGFRQAVKIYEVPWKENAVEQPAPADVPRLAATAELAPKA